MGSRECCAEKKCAKMHQKYERVNNWEKAPGFGVRRACMNRALPGDELLYTMRATGRIQAAVDSFSPAVNVAAGPVSVVSFGRIGW